MALLQSTRTNGEDGSAEEDEIVVETIEQEKRDFSEADKIDDKMLAEGIPPDSPYTRFVVEKPWTAWTIGLVSILLFVGIGVGITFGTRDFKLSGATVGFESRNTEKAGETVALSHIARLECEGSLTLRGDGIRSRYYRHDVIDDTDDPREIESSTCYEGFTDSSSRRLNRRLNERAAKFLLANTMALTTDGNTSSVVKRKLTRSNFPKNLVSSANSWEVKENGKMGMTLFYSGEDLFTKDAIVSMCELEDQVKAALTNWDSLCTKQSFDGDVTCAPSRSIGNYIAALQGRASCRDITDTDVSTTKDLLRRCRGLFDSKKLVGNCWNWDDAVATAKADTAASDPTCSGDFEICAKYNAVYDSFYSLLEKGYLREGDEQPLKYAQTLLTHEYMSYNDYNDADLLSFAGRKSYSTKLEVVYSDLKGEYFNAGMQNETVMFVFLFLIVYAFILFHTGSFWITTWACFQIVMAFAVGFVFYSVFAWRQFFPFLNLVTLFLIMGVGADDIFVFIDAWKQSFVILPDECPLSNRLSWTLRRAGGAMLVTTVTTASSFFANMVASISTLKVFGLFTGLVVISDFILMLGFIPATVIVHHKYFSIEAGEKQVKYSNSKAKESSHKVQSIQMKQPGAELARRSSIGDVEGGKGASKEGEGEDEGDPMEIAEATCGCLNCCCCVTKFDPDFCAIPSERDDNGRLKHRWGERIFEKHVSSLLFHPILRWVFVFGTAGLSYWLVSKSTELKNPQSSYMQLLDASHPLELYSKTYENYFDIQDGRSFQFPYYIVTGLEPIDNGDGFEPTDRGTPIFNAFNLSSREAQKWALDVCITAADWDYSPQESISDLNQNPCPMYWFKRWMTAKCETNHVEWQLSPYRKTCCGYDSFPFDPNVFESCIQEFANHFESYDIYHGFWFDIEGHLKVYSVRGDSNMRYTQSFDPVKEFYQKVKNLEKGLPLPPSNTLGLDKTFVSTEITFFSLQEAITTGATNSALISTGFALGILLLFTNRIIGSIFATITIACTVFCVIGIFVYLGWELNVVEAIIISVSVGLACDFSAHLTHAYNNAVIAEEENTPLYFPTSLEEFKAHLRLSSSKATTAITELGVTVTLGYLTTTSAGLILIAGNLYFFQQFGIFLGTIMAFTYAFAFLMLMPCLASFGWLDRLLRAYVFRLFGWDPSIKGSPLDKPIEGVGEGEIDKDPCNASNGEVYDVPEETRPKIDLVKKTLDNEVKPESAAAHKLVQPVKIILTDEENELL